MDEINTQKLIVFPYSNKIKDNRSRNPIFNSNKKEKISRYTHNKKCERSIHKKTFKILLRDAKENRNNKK